MQEFTKQYKLAHTLTFELKPVGKTLEHLKSSGLLEQDLKRSEDYKKAKIFLDELHKKFLQESFSKIHDIDWQPLAENLKKFRIDEIGKKDLEKAQENYREKLVAYLKKNEYFKDLTEATPSKLFKDLDKSGETPEEIKTFARFACYFKGYQENRRNIYSAEAQSTAAAHRAVNENFVKYANAVDTYLTRYTQYPELISQIAERTADLRGDLSLDVLLQINNYNRFLPQSGIDAFNKIVSEINYAVNLFRQSHKEIPSRDLPFLAPLFKQILSDREQAFAIDAFQNDAELLDAIKSFIEYLSNTEIHGDAVDLPVSLRQVLVTLSDEDQLFVDASELDKISCSLLGRWDAIREAMEEYAQKTFPAKAKKEKYCSQPVYSFNDLKQWKLKRPSAEGAANSPIAITSYWQTEAVAALFSKEQEYRSSILALTAKDCSGHLREQEDDVHTIKEYFDTILDILHLVKPLYVSAEYGGDIDLLGIIAEHYNKLEAVVPLYNKIRNYIAKKVTETEKIKLMFNVPTLADGWDCNKETANAAVLLQKGGAYFLGIMNPKTKIAFDQLPKAVEGSYQKMVYKLLPGPNKMLPKVFFSKKNIDFYAPSPDLLKKYENKEHIKGGQFDLRFCHELIDFFKHSIMKHPDWSQFGFVFRDTESYAGIDEFYREVETQGYKVNFDNIQEATIHSLVSEGKLYLFQIWNKDFREAAHGTPDKFTIYWRTLFAGENLADVVFKLNGEAELFMRQPAITSPVKHKVGEKMVNRTVIEGFDADDRAIRTPIPENIHHEIFCYVNGRSTEPLSDTTLEFLKCHPRLDWAAGMDIHDAQNRVIVKNVTHELIKDKRYTEQKFQFHVPITVNFKCGDAFKFNDKVLAYLKNNPDVKIIGIDRGERNLIYFTLIDQAGHILIQKSFNLANGVDYHEKLDQREKERDNARKSWKSIGRIKDLKDGYISAVVHEIVTLMVKNNAIVVMEDLNAGFKRGRTKFEKQIYQKFERALIEKLNYLVFKNEKDPHAPGGVLNGYQLTPKFESFSKLGKQCGFLFYIPAGYTSKIDPTTGFTNLFNMKKCTNAENRKAFLEQFDSIKYDADKGSFAFAFDYKNFKTGQTSWKTDWVVYSARQRFVYSARERRTLEINPTQIIINALEARGVCLSDGFDLLAYICSVDAEPANASFFADIIFAFDRTLQMRNSPGERDYIESPVRNKTGQFFNSETADETLPQNADANGAFHIALKGLYLLKEVIPSSNEKINLKIEHAKWFEFVQKRNM